MAGVVSARIRGVDENGLIAAAGLLMIRVLKTGRVSRVAACLRGFMAVVAWGRRVV